MGMGDDQKPGPTAADRESGWAGSSLADRIRRYDLSIGARLRDARTAKRKSQDWLAQATGVSYQSIQRYERGAAISAGRLVEAADALDVSVAFLMRDIVNRETYPLTKTRDLGKSRSALSNEAYHAARLLDEVRDRDIRRSLITIIERLAAV
ncbi:MAG: hypothetical protein CMI63_19525 [Parvularcula sp.]|nr:hypothetical protein [Parvularcula sp.]